MLTTIRYVLLTALRDRLFFALVACVALSVMLSRLLGSTALVEQDQMSLTFAAASARVILVIGLVVFVCFHIRNAFESREIDVMLSRPISRANLVLAYQFGFSLVAFLLVAAAAAILVILKVSHWQGWGAWSASCFLEMSLVIALALFSAFTLRSAVSSVMMSLGFYVLSRMMGYFVLTSENSGMFDSEALNMAMRKALIFVSMLVPRLDLFTQSDWLVYGMGTYPDAIRLFLLQAVVFTPLLLTAAIIDFRRKQF